MDLSPFKEALLRKRGEILSAGGGIKPLQASMDTNTRQGDLADQASGNNEVHIQLKLKQTDAKILQAIEEALYRMEKGTYGVCRDCGEPIAPARLNAIPWTRVCITCKEKQKTEAGTFRREQRDGPESPARAHRVRCRARGAPPEARGGGSRRQQLRLQ